MTGRDVNPLETESVFTTLIRLKDALEANDIEAIEAAIAKIDGDLNRVNFGRSEVGARQQSLEILATRLEDEEVELKAVLSLDIDADLTEAISEFAASTASEAAWTDC
jgi:flagellin-like hook-associated protein FlgL